ncbi:unnamed protein product [Pedinophyceae sp. YPF-701]|nr:unnamed protein product [Pedinophyceae sp. YPF-701]
MADISWGVQQDDSQAENLADLYAIIKTTEKLEQAYIRDLIGSDTYEQQCLKLIGQFKTLWSTLQGAVPDVRAFMHRYGLEAPLAVTRLVQSGVPATLEHGRPQKTAAPTGAQVADAVQNLITLKDALAMGLKAVDQVFPEMQATTESLARVRQLPASSSVRERMVRWLNKLHQLPASHELGAEDLRQLAHDVEVSYQEFMQILRDESEGA